MEALNIIGNRSSILEPLVLVSANRRTRMWDSTFCRSLLFLISLFLSVAPSPAQRQHPTEPQVKAAYLYNFGKFVRWQTDQVSSSDSLQICVLGKDPFGPVLDSTITGESIEGRRITAKRITSVQEAKPCSILFISSSEEKRLSFILSAAQHMNALTVSDSPHFVEQGGMIGFVMQEGRIRFEVNRAAAEQSHLLLSSELLKVATKVIATNLPGN